MADFVNISVNLIHLTVTASSAIIKFVQAVFTFNFHLISGVLQVLKDACYALCTIISLLAAAFYDILGYIFDFGVEVSFLLDCWGRYVAELSVHLYKGLCVLAEWLADFSVYMLWKLAGFLQEVFQICVEGLYSAGELALSVYHILAAGFLTAYGAVELLLTKSTKVSNDSFSIIVNNSHALALSSVQLAKALTDTVGRGIFYIFTDFLQGIPFDVYLGLTVMSGVFLTCKYIGDCLNRNGLTVPFFGWRNDQMELNNINWRESYLIDSSDDEADNDEDENRLRGNTEDAASSSGSENDSNLIHTDSDDSDSDVSDNAVSGEESDDDDQQHDIDIRLAQPSAEQPNGSQSQGSSSSAMGASELEQILEDERDKRLCVVCQDQLKNVLILPCRHMCLCVGCAREIALARYINQRICPLCRSPIQTIMDVYV